MRLAFVFLALIVAAVASPSPALDKKSDKCPGYCLICEPPVPPTTIPTETAHTHPHPHPHPPPMICGCALLYTKCAPKVVGPNCPKNGMICDDGSQFWGCDTLNQVSLENVPPPIDSPTPIGTSRPTHGELKY